MDYCIQDAKLQGKSGVCMLGAKKQKAWLSDQSFAKKFDFEVVDRSDSGYELLALSFDGNYPKFKENAKIDRIQNQELTIYYDRQCPYSYQLLEKIRQYCDENDIPLVLNLVDSLERAKALPAVFNNHCVFYKGKFVTTNFLDVAILKKILNK